MIDHLPNHTRVLLNRLRKLASERFAPRAVESDRNATFPAADFEELFDAGLHAPGVPAEFGGGGFAPGLGVYALWMMTKELAKADLSLARCWEGHLNSQVLIGALGTEKQKREWFKGIVEDGDLWVAWSGEPQTKTPGQNARFGTRVTETEGGYIVNGTKVFASSAGHADKAILLVNTEGPGGARHASSSPDSLLLLVCDLDDKSVTFDDSWWDPIGMRGTVSYLVRFDETFIPQENLLGRPGVYLHDAWQTRFSPHYGSSFLGAAEAAYEYALETVRKRSGESDPYTQHRIARMAMNVETAHLWLGHVSDLWDQGRVEEAKAGGNKVRWQLEQLATETIEHAIHVCGARALMRPCPLERIYRDLSIYTRHDNIDRVLATIGQQIAGEADDLSFFNAQPRPAGVEGVAASTQPPTPEK